MNNKYYFLQISFYTKLNNVQYNQTARFNPLIYFMKVMQMCE